MKDKAPGTLFETIMKYLLAMILVLIGIYLILFLVDPVFEKVRESPKVRESELVVEVSAEAELRWRRYMDLQKSSVRRPTKKKVSS